MEWDDPDLAAGVFRELVPNVAGKPGIVDDLEDVAHDASRRSLRAIRSTSRQASGSALAESPSGPVNTGGNEPGLGARQRPRERLVIGNCHQPIAAVAQDPVDKIRLEELCPGGRRHVAIFEILYVAAVVGRTIVATGTFPERVDGCATSP